ncbi:hypothetical protein, partial [Streptococcus pneumoniae]|uniref:hypothetical protein n=1 Tax=Streptococcus pneumoniae TaxID=1313 RepID=UPI001E33C6AF
EKISAVRKIYEDKYVLEKELSNIENTRVSYERDLSLIKSKDTDFEFKLAEANKFVGHKVLAYKNYILEDDYSHYENERLIE